VKAQDGKVTLYDFNANGMIEKTKPLYPELAGKPIGLVLQREEYEKQTGEVGERMIIVGPFESSTNRMAVEILDNAEAHSLDGLLRWLESNPVKKLRGARRAEQPAHADSSDGSNFADDDIPFAPLNRREHW